MPKVHNIFYNEIEIQKEIIRAVAQIVAAAPASWQAADKAKLSETLIQSFYDGLETAMSKYLEPFDS